jgi:predicted O-methyltransferase YrrM
METLLWGRDQDSVCIFSIAHEVSSVEECLRLMVDDLLVQGKTQFLQKKECCAGALEGRLIATLCRLSGAKTVLEVGMFTGTTTLAIAEAIPADGKATSIALPYPLPTHVTGITLAYN